MVDEKIKERARKLHALAERGIGGEKTNAQTMLDAFLKKHNLKIIDKPTPVHQYQTPKYHHTLTKEEIEAIKQKMWDEYHERLRPQQKKEWWLKRFWKRFLKILFPPFNGFDEY